MADDNNIGAVGILITGDASTLDAAFAAAQANAQRAGSSIASAFTGAVSPAVKTATGLVDQYGRAIQSATQATAPLVQVTNAAAASVTRLGAAHGAAVSQIQATSGALRVLEGSGGLRAAERFIATTLGLGGAFQAIFPVVGLLAVGEIVGRVGTQLYDMYANARDASERIGGTFRDLVSGLDATNDDLILTGDKLDSAWAKLNSEPGNQLKTSIHEAVVEADKLRSALNAALDAAYQVAKANTQGLGTDIFQGLQAAGGLASGSVKGAARFVTGLAARQSSVQGIGGEAGYGGLRAQENNILDEELPKLRDATTEEQKRGVQLEINTRLAKAYGDEITRQRSLAGVPGIGTAGSEIATGLAADLTRQNLERQLRQQDTDKQARNEALEAQRSAASEQADVALASLQLEISGNEQRAGYARTLAEQEVEAAHATRAAKIAAIEDPRDRNRAEAAEAITLAEAKRTALEAIDQRYLDSYLALLARKKALEAQGKTPAAAEKAQSGVTGESSAASAKAAEAFLQFDGEVSKAKENATAVNSAEDRKQADEDKKTAEERARIWQEYHDKVADSQRRITEIQEKSGGQQAGTRIQGQIIAIQGNAALGGAQTPQQQIAQMQQIAALEAQQRDLKLQAALAEERTAEAAAQEAFDAGDISKALHDSADAATKKFAAEELSLENANAYLEAQYKIAEAIQAQNLAHQIGAEITAAANSVPGALGGAISSGIFNGGKKGEDVGQQIEKSLKNVGQQLFGQLLTTAIKQLIVTIGLNTAGDAILHALGLTQTVAQAANTVALLANTAALIASAGATGAGGVIGIATEIGGVFAGGGSPPVGVASIVGEKGPELFIPDSAGTVIPSGSFGGATGLPAVSGVSSSGSLSVGEMHFHAHGMTNPKEFTRQVVREIPNFLKSAGPQFAASQSKS